MLRLKNLVLRAPWSVLAFGLLLTTSDRLAAQQAPAHGDVYSLLKNQADSPTKSAISAQQPPVLSGPARDPSAESPTRALPNPFRDRSELVHATRPTSQATLNQSLTSPTAEIDLGTGLVNALAIEQFEATNAVTVAAEGALSDENILRASACDDQEPQAFFVAGDQPQLLGPMPSDGPLMGEAPQPLAGVAREVEGLSSEPEVSHDSQEIDLADLYRTELAGAAPNEEQPNGTEPYEAAGSKVNPFSSEFVEPGQPELAAHPLPQGREIEESAGNEKVSSKRFSDDDLFALAKGLENAGYTPDAHRAAGEVVAVMPASMNREDATPRLPKLVPIRDIFVDVAPRQVVLGEKKSETDLPENLASEQFGPYSAAVVGANEDVRYAPTQYLWVSPASRHKPLYFEQPNLERYGTHAGGDCLASAAATGRFVVDTLALPYQLGVHGPSECIYTLGVYRPGNCTPHYFHVEPISPKGLLYQGAVVTGLVFLIP